MSSRHHRSSSRARSRSRGPGGGSGGGRSPRASTDDHSAMLQSEKEKRHDQRSPKATMANKSGNSGRDREMKEKGSSSREKSSTVVRDSPKVHHTKNGTTSTSSVRSGGTSSLSSQQQQQHRTPQQLHQEQQKQAALREYKELYNSTAQVVKNMLFVDYYGDRGRYTGEVNESKLPHGSGEIRYDHGLVQEGKWVCLFYVYIFVCCKCIRISNVKLIVFQNLSRPLLFWYGCTYEQK